MKYSQILIIHNPVSGTQDSDAIRKKIEDMLSRFSISYEYAYTNKDGSLPSISNAVDAVCVMGGDGTVMSVISKVIDEKYDVPVMVVPLGTGNLLARAISIPLDPSEALTAQITASKTQQYDVGKLHTDNSYFMVSIGIGLDAQMIKKADRQQKNTYGFLAYVLSGIKSIANRKKRTFEVVLDGERQILRAHSIMIFNAARLEILDTQLGPEVNPRDGHFDIAILRDTSPAGFTMSLFRLLTGNLKEKGEPEYIQAETVKVKSFGTPDVQMDGELLTIDTIDVSILKNAISFMYIEKHS